MATVPDTGNREQFAKPIQKRLVLRGRGLRLMLNGDSRVNSNNVQGLSLEVGATYCSGVAKTLPSLWVNKLFVFCEAEPYN